MHIEKPEKVRPRFQKTSEKYFLENIELPSPIYWYFSASDSSVREFITMNEMFGKIQRFRKPLSLNGALFCGR